MRLNSILIVEDEDYLRQGIAEALKSKGYTVLTAPDGRAALEVLKTVTAPCLLLVDLMMPNMDGWELLEKLKEIVQSSKITHRALVMSGSPTAEEIAHQEGAGFLAKPFRLSELLVKLDQY
jgi:CheY-like chemotaxis protein